MNEVPCTGSLTGLRATLDSSVPNVARIYDVLLGGKDNYAADRQAARRLLAAIPDAARAALDNRAFLARAVHFLAAEAGIGQFLDIGTGIPARGHVHAIARAANPDARVAYIDNDPVVVAYANALAVETPGVAAVNADLRFPSDLMTNRVVRAIIDFDMPVAVLLVAVLHFVADSESPWTAVRCIIDHLAPGSYLVVSHVTGDEITADAVQQAREIYDGAIVQGTARSRDDIERFFDGLELVAPGVVNVSAWRPPGRRPPSQAALFWLQDSSAAVTGDQAGRAGGGSLLAGGAAPNGHENRPGRDDSTEREAAARIREDRPGWVVAWILRKGQFQARPLFPAPRGTVAVGGTPAELTVEMDKIRPPAPGRPPAQPGRTP